MPEQLPERWEYLLAKMQREGAPESPYIRALIKANERQALQLRKLKKWSAIYLGFSIGLAIGYVSLALYVVRHV